MPVLVVAPIMMTALRMFGYSQKELVGQNVATIVPEPMATMHQRFLTKYMETGDTHFLGTTRTVLAVKQGGDIIPIVQTTTSMENSFAGLFQVRSISSFALGPLSALPFVSSVSLRFAWNVCVAPPSMSAAGHG